MGIKRYELSEVQWARILAQVVGHVYLRLDNPSHTGHCPAVMVNAIYVVFSGGRLACLSYPMLHVLLSSQMPRRP